MKQSLNIFIPVPHLEGIGKGDFDKLPAQSTYDLKISYPLETPAIFKIHTGKNGMGLIALLSKIGTCYRKVYEQEDKDGRYNIWGHAIEDLFLDGITVDHSKKLITLSMGS